MREIKFRVWSKLMNRFCLNTEDGYFGQEEDFGNGIFKIWNYEKDSIVQQFTGLKDKNGREIYEGDILKCEDGENYKVFYESGMFVLNFYKMDSLPILVYFADHAIIAGNIFENPELLNNK